MRADLQDPGSPRGLRPRRSARIGALRKDDSQRDRVRIAPGLRRGLRDPARVEGFQARLAADSAVWNRGSVVRSWLNELAERAFAKDTELGALKGYIEDSGEGRWTVQEAIDLDVPAPVITLSLLTRLSLSPERFLRGQSHRGASQRVRRPRGEEAMTARASASVIATTQEHAIPGGGRKLRRPEPCTMIIFGAGDLLHRKLMPSLFHLMEDGLLPDDFTVITVARESLDEGTFRTQVGDAIRTFLPNGATADKTAIANFTRQLYYCSGELNDVATYDTLRARLAETDARQPGGSGRLFYLAIPPRSMPAQSTCWRNRVSPRE